jgi:hypothetical protein
MYVFVELLIRHVCGHKLVNVLRLNPVIPSD